MRDRIAICGYQFSLEGSPIQGICEKIDEVVLAQFLVYLSRVVERTVAVQQSERYDKWIVLFAVDKVSLMG